MGNIFAIAEMIVALALAITTLALSEGLLRAGIKRWGWVLVGLVLIFAGSALSLAFGLKSFARLFIPEMAQYAAGVAFVLRLLGLVVIFLTFLLSVRALFRAKQREQKKLDSLRLLEVMRDTVNQSLSLIELLSFSVRELARETDSSAGAIFIHNPNRGQLVLAARRDLPIALEKNLESLDDTGTIIFRAHKNNSPHMLGDIGNADEQTRRLMAGFPFKSLLAVPLSGRSGSLGVAVLLAEKPFFFSREQTQLVVSACNLLGPAIAALRLEREARETMDKLNQLQISGKFLSDLISIPPQPEALDQVLGTAFDLAEKYLGLSAGHLVLPTPGGISFRFPSQRAHPNFESQINNIQRAMEKGKALLVRIRDGGQIRRVLIVPQVADQKSEIVLVFQIEPDRPDPIPETIHNLRNMAGVLGWHLKLERGISTGARSISLAEPGLQLDYLNDLNNTLTGIIGKSQLLAVALQKSAFGGQTRAVQTLQKIVEEAYHAGEAIRSLQERLNRQITSTRAETDLGSVLSALLMPDRTRDDSTYIHHQKTKLRFRLEIMPKTYAAILPEIARAILTKAFDWIDEHWRPSDPLFIRMINAGQKVYLLITEVFSDWQAADLKVHSFLPVSNLLNLDDSISGNGQSVADISYSAGNEGQRYLILSFPARIPPASISTPRRARPRILAIDDQEVIRELLASMLEELDYPHQICGDGRSGLEAFMRGGFDIVVTDLGLPDLDGWDLVRKIKESRPDTPVIVITGWGLDAERRKALGQLADYILSKPFRMEQLGEMILAAESRRMALP